MEFTIFVNINCKKQELINNLKSSLSDCVSERSSIALKGIHVFVDANENYDQKLAEDMKYGFIHYKYRLEFLLEKEVNHIIFANFILMLFWSHGYQAICASDFEEELLNFDNNENRLNIPNKF